MSAFLLPTYSHRFGGLNIKNYGNIKDVGDSNSSPIPGFRPSHCLVSRISNASQPTPSDIIYTTILHISIYVAMTGI